MRIAAFHGSPGGHADFEPLDEALPGIFLAAGGEAREDDVLVGYSFGAVRLLHAMQDSGITPRGIVLISPWIREKERSSALEFFLSVPVLSTLLLKVVGQPVMLRFARASCRPDPVPRRLLARLRDYASPRALRRTLTEKVGALEGLGEVAWRLHEVPVLCLLGEKDRHSGIEDLHWLRRYWGARLRVEVLDGAGHALLWTRTEQVARHVQEFLASLPAGEDA